jgi:chemotaxis protein MotB
MALGRARSTRYAAEAWPAYVDMLSTLLLVVVFVLVVFVLAQFFLAQALSGRDKVLLELNRQVAELSDLLALEKRANAELRLDVAQLSASLQESGAARDTLAARLAALQQKGDDAEKRLAEARGIVVILEGKLDEALRGRAKAEAEAADLGGKLTSAAELLEEEKKLSDAARSQVDLLNQQLIALRQQLARLEQALEAAEAKDRQSQAQIVDLGRRLNLALAQKVEELARYRSEFFGRLREALGDRRDIVIVGDRFVFQSEVLFDSGSAELNDAGRAQLAKLAATLLEIAANIPTELKWVLRVDGHTDRVPIRTAHFPSNWELSTARALAVTRFLIAEGVPPARLAATGFGEFQPIDERNDEIGYRRNRRIEFKLTER